VSLNIDGQLVVLQDTAGLRTTDDAIEKEGIKRAMQAADQADLVFWLSAHDELIPEDLPKNTILVRTKADARALAVQENPITVSVKNDASLEPFLNILRQHASTLANTAETSLISRQRHKIELTACLGELRASLEESLDLELRTDHLRRAGDALGRLTGRIDTEDLLDVIFSEFCVGK